MLNRNRNDTRHGFSRRSVSALLVSFGVLPAAGSAGQAFAPLNLPREVAGITLPRSRLAMAAASFSRNACPDFLFNHCMRTYVFGALALHRQKLSYNADLAFVASSLHDLGLLPAFESPKLSFEIDGANAAERFARSAGSSAADANSVWFDVALHAGRFAITRRMGPDAMLVALGAASDVDGPDLDTEDEKKQMAEIVVAFPRLQFKHKLTSLLVDHCKRKPTSQRGTWLEGLCREQVPSAWSDTVEKEIAGSPFAE